MGADAFQIQVRGTDASKAFWGAREEAKCENGGGYSGTIAEKDGFTMSKNPKEIDADEWVDKLDSFDPDDTEHKYYSELKKDYGVYDDKWGDALCIPITGGFIFCGYASS